MDTDLLELENLVTMQESYFDNLIELGLLYEQEGLHQKALEIYIKGAEIAGNAKKDFMEIILGLLD